MTATKSVLDTTILQKANALLSHEPSAASLFIRRLRLLQSFVSGERTALISRRLIIEYRRQIPTPRNDFVSAFLSILARPGGAELNWDKSWSSHRESARRCRFPPEDYHVLRTAILEDYESVVFTEEDRMLRTNRCVHRRLGVHVLGLP